MHRHHLTHSLVATVLAVVVMLAPGLRPHPLVVAAVFAVAGALVWRSYATHRHDTGGTHTIRHV